MSNKNNQLFTKIVKEGKQKKPKLLAIKPERGDGLSKILVGGEAFHRPRTTTEKPHIIAIEVFSSYSLTQPRFRNNSETRVYTSSQVY